MGCSSGSLQLEEVFFAGVLLEVPVEVVDEVEVVDFEAGAFLAVVLFEAEVLGAVVFEAVVRELVDLEVEREAVDFEAPAAS